VKQTPTGEEPDPHPDGLILDSSKVEPGPWGIAAILAHECLSGGKTDNVYLSDLELISRLYRTGIKTDGAISQVRADASAVNDYLAGLIASQAAHPSTVNPVVNLIETSEDGYGYRLAVDRDCVRLDVSDELRSQLNGTTPYEFDPYSTFLGALKVHKGGAEYRDSAPTSDDRAEDTGSTAKASNNASSREGQMGRARVQLHILIRRGRIESGVLSFVPPAGTGAQRGFSAAQAAILMTLFDAAISGQLFVPTADLTDALDNLRVWDIVTYDKIFRQIHDIRRHLEALAIQRPRTLQRLTGHAKKTPKDWAETVVANVPRVGYFIGLDPELLELIIRPLD
jgi:hypothetical protein